MGQCLLYGWSERQFWFSSYRAVFNLLRAGREKAEREIREGWEQTRMICDYVIAPYRSKGAAGRAFELPWDNEMLPQEISVLSDEEKEKLFARWDRKIKKKLNGKG